MNSYLVLFRSDFRPMFPVPFDMGNRFGTQPAGVLRLRYDINQEVGQRVFLGHFEAGVRLNHQGYGSQRPLKIAQQDF